MGLPSPDSKFNIYIFPYLINNSKEYLKQQIYREIFKKSASEAVLGYHITRLSLNPNLNNLLLEVINFKLIKTKNIMVKACNRNIISKDTNVCLMKNLIERKMQTK